MEGAQGDHGGKMDLVSFGLEIDGAGLSGVYSRSTLEAAALLIGQEDAGWDDISSNRLPDPTDQASCVKISRAIA